MLAILNKPGDELVCVFPEAGMTGLAPVRKVQVEGGWELQYGNEVLAHKTTESAIDTAMTNLRSYLNTRQTNCCKTADEINGLP